MRQIKIACVAVLGLLVGFGAGLACYHFRFPPYDEVMLLAKTCRNSMWDLQDRWSSRSLRGRFMQSRPAGPPRHSLARLQEKEMEALRAIGYASGTVKAPPVSGVTRYDPARAYAGLNLLYDGHAPEAVVMDMKGRIVHRWRFSYARVFPETRHRRRLPVATRYWRRVKLLDNGDLLAVFDGWALIKIDRDSRLLWVYPERVHHDLDVLADGTIYVLIRKAEIVERISAVHPVLHDFIVILDANGREQARFSVIQAIENSAYSSLLMGLPDPSLNGDILHTNSLRVLDGSLADRIPAFRAGNVLISLPTLNTIAVIDLRLNKVVWALSGLAIFQHDPKILPNGNLLLFDNRRDRGRSRILELDPRTQEIPWQYDGGHESFYSRTCGTNQRLPNGNTLITETDNGRALEVTRDKATVWEYYTPNRAGEHKELIASLLEVVRLNPDSLSWLGGSSQ